MVTDHIIPEFHFGARYQVHYPSRSDWEGGTPRGLQFWDESVKCFTDGSRMDSTEMAGAGIFCEQPSIEVSVPLGQYATVFQAEAVAIHDAATFLSDYDTVRTEVIYLCSDSLSALQAIERPKVVSALVKECKVELNRLSQKHFVGLVWVPGHSGVQGNERADGLARTGAQTPPDQDQSVGLSRQAVRRAINAWLSTAHMTYWRQVSGCRQAKLTTAGPQRKRTRHLLQLSRKSLRVVVGMLTGHFRFVRHLHLMHLVDSPLCEQCGEAEETALHFMGDCPAYSWARIQHLGSDPLTYDDIAYLRVGDLASYANRTGRFDQ